jgi:hypothetical protein
MLPAGSSRGKVAHGSNLSDHFGGCRVKSQWQSTLLDRWKHPEILLSEVLQNAPVRALRDRPTAQKAVAMLAEAGWVVPLEKGTMVRGAARKEAYRIVRPAHVV